MSYCSAIYWRRSRIGSVVLAVAVSFSAVPAAAQIGAGSDDIWRRLEDRAAGGKPATRAEKEALVAEVSRRNPRFARWWARQPAHLKQRLYGERLTMWRPIVLCHYLGFDPKTDKGRDCEISTWRRIREAGRRWTRDGRYIGPSADCIRANRRNRYGELVCD